MTPYHFSAASLATLRFCDPVLASSRTDIKYTERMYREGPESARLPPLAKSRQLTQDRLPPLSKILDSGPDQVSGYAIEVPGFTDSTLEDRPPLLSPSGSFATFPGPPNTGVARRAFSRLEGSPSNALQAQQPPPPDVSPSGELLESRASIS